MPTRPYSMTARAASVAATGERIIDAVVELAGEQLLATIALDDVASRAGVSVQTVLRRFGSRTGLIEAATARAQDDVRDERRTPVGDVPTAMAVLVDHYEKRGRLVLLLLAQEEHEPLVADITRGGRALHQAWVEDAFAPFLPDDAAAREESLDLLVVACDVTTWKLLRLDRGLSRPHTQARMERLVRAVLTTTTPGLGPEQEG